ncbi:hypothetical protein BDQ17DRAFT_279284 [Cyathus striatus]|nr:hypothetical protein BDQ17DRAFT_279284 [Cyathus striatus]
MQDANANDDADKDKDMDAEEEKEKEKEKESGKKNVTVVLKNPPRMHPPPLYYLPAKLLPSQEKFLERRKKEVSIFLLFFFVDSGTTASFCFIYSVFAISSPFHFNFVYVFWIFAISSLFRFDLLFFLALGYSSCARLHLAGISNFRTILHSLVMNLVSRNMVHMYLRNLPSAIYRRALLCTNVILVSAFRHAFAYFFHLGMNWLICYSITCVGFPPTRVPLTGISSRCDPVPGGDHVRGWRSQAFFNFFLQGGRAYRVHCILMCIWARSFYSFLTPPLRATLVVLASVPVTPVPNCRGRIFSVL